VRTFFCPAEVAGKFILAPIWEQPAAPEVRLGEQQQTIVCMGMQSIAGTDLERKVEKMCKE